MTTPLARIDANLCAIEDDLRELARSADHDVFEQIVALQERAADLFDTAREQIVNRHYAASQARFERTIEFYAEITSA